jgi:quinoprotein glucose dehydrogenase
MNARHLLSLALALCAPAAAQDWPAYGNDPGGTRYSSLNQITRSNVSRLKIAWTYHTGALEPATRLNEKAAFEATPILVDGTLYLSTPYDQVIALDPATGAERWKYDPRIDRTHGYSEVTSRGVAAWRDSKTGRRRIFIGAIDARLIALDAESGKPCADFGDQGQVDLTRDVMLLGRGNYQVTSPPAIAGDLVIVGSSIGDNRAASVERGIVRAYDARSGQLKWTWDPIPWSDRNSPRTGAANAWSVLSVDAARDLVFIPTGSAAPDFYGGLRPGDNKWANSVVALRASTGKFVWGFQVVHHDLWDYDVASQPVLFTYQGKPAVAVTTKMGNLFVLDRETGKPLHEVTERNVPRSHVPGEEASPTQPFSSFPPLVPRTLSAADAWGLNAEEQAWCKERIASLHNEGMFTPPSLEGTLAFPGNVGGVNWGSAAVDSSRGILVANTDRLPFLLKLIPRDKLPDERTSARDNRLQGEFGVQAGTAYAVYREPLLSPRYRTPCNKPPWGTVTAIDLKSGKILWDVPLGSLDKDLPPGSLNLGGPILTAGGLVFTAAAKDPFLRAFDVDTGKEIWKAELPASAQATPMTYSVGGKQYVVICAGGHGKLQSKQGDAVVAFTLEM